MGLITDVHKVKNGKALLNLSQILKPDRRDYSADYTNLPDATKAGGQHAPDYRHQVTVQ